MKTQVGVFLTLARGLERLQSLEDMGFDSLWAGEHFRFPNPTHDVVPLLGAYAAVTRKITIGSAVLLLPFRHPVVTAKAAVTIDLISEGRFILGVGLGGEDPEEFLACGLPLEGRGKLTDEAMILLRRLWSEENVTHNGMHFQVRDITLSPTPFQQGGPPMWVGGRSIAAMRRAALLADGYIPHFLSPQAFSQAREQIAGYADEAGRDISKFGWGAMVFLGIGDDKKTAQARASVILKPIARHMENIFRKPFEELIQEPAFILGSREECLEGLQRYKWAGVEHLTFWPFPREGQPLFDYLAECATEILPTLHHDATFM